LLGPLQVWRAGRPVRLAGREQRLLAVLLLAPNRVVPVNRLVDAIWGSRPPANARRQTQNSVSVLRARLLADGAAGAATMDSPIVTDGPGYRLRVATDRVDAARFERLVTQARALDPEQAVPAVELLTSALALWRGAALAGLSGQEFQAVAHRLEEQRLAACEHRIELLLGLDGPARPATFASGSAGELVAELTELVAVHPLRERLVGNLMRVLHRAGRQAEALSVYQRLRERLAEELGVDPSPPLQRLHRTLLRNEESDAAAPASTPHPPAPTDGLIPRQLPASVSHFVGRLAELRELNRLIPAHRGGGGPVAAPIAAVVGTAGVGKTALGVHWARRVADRFPDGQLYVNLRGFDPDGRVMTPAEALRGFLIALQVPAERIPDALDAQAALYRSRLAGKGVLILLDNARDADHVRYLLPGTAGCMVVVTSRHRLSGLVAADGAHLIQVNLLNQEEARDLLARRLGADQIAAEPAVVDEIIVRCSGLPLALAVVAARAAARPGFTLAAVAKLLRDAGDGLDGFAGDDPTTNLRTVLSWSYEGLTAPAARLFRLLSLDSGPDMTAPAAASLAAVSLTQVRALLGELVERNLLAEPTPGRFTFHDLLRGYAAELVATQEPDQQRLAAHARLLTHFLHTAHAAAMRFTPFRYPIRLPPPASGVVAQRCGSMQEALVWFESERASLVAAFHDAISAGLDTFAWQLSWTLARFLERGGHWQTWIAIPRLALDAARRLGEPTALAHSHHELARAHAWLGQLDDAFALLNQARALFERTREIAGQADVEVDVGWIKEDRQRYREALRHYDRSLGLYRAIGDRCGEARALNNLGWAWTHLGEHDRALDACQRAIALYGEMDDADRAAAVVAEGAAWDTLARAHHLRGDLEQAIACYKQAIALYPDCVATYWAACAMADLGDVYHDAGEPTAARDASRQALGMLDKLGHPKADEVRKKLQASEHPVGEPPRLEIRAGSFAS
jgi:DNA-binding SARP family transcriptional activator